MLFFFIILLGILTPNRGDVMWANDYDGYLYFECPEGSAITHLRSIHDNHHEDRVWAFDCQTVKKETKITACAWTGYVNNLDEPFSYECAEGAGLITGMESVHDNHHEDRQWKYKCCYTAETCYHDCHQTDPINAMDKPMDYLVQDGYWISGLQSVHDNHHEDREWRLHLCKIQDCWLEETFKNVDFDIELKKGVNSTLLIWVIWETLILNSIKKEFQKA